MIVKVVKRSVLSVKIIAPTPLVLPKQLEKNKLDVKNLA